MKEFKVNKHIWDTKEVREFAKAGDMIVLLPDKKTFVNNSLSSQKTFNPSEEELNDLISNGTLELVFDTQAYEENMIMKPKTVDMVNHPPHYTWLKEKCGIEVIDITRHFNNNLGNVLKYVLRHGHKFEQGMSTKEKAVQDLEKAMFYLKDEIDKLKKG